SVCTERDTFSGQYRLGGFCAIELASADFADHSVLGVECFHHDGPRQLWHLFLLPANWFARPTGLCGRLHLSFFRLFHVLPAFSKHVGSFSPWLGDAGCRRFHSNLLETFARLFRIDFRFPVPGWSRRERTFVPHGLSTLCPFSGLEKDSPRISHLGLRVPVGRRRCHSFFGVLVSKCHLPSAVCGRSKSLLCRTA